MDSGWLGVLSVSNSLGPVWIRDDGDLLKSLTVKVVLDNHIISRTTKTYGQQEYAIIETRTNETT